MVAIFSRERPPNHGAITQPAQALISPPRGSVCPSRRFLPDHAFHDEDGEGPLDEGARQRGPPSPLLGDDDRLRALAGLDLGGDRLGGEVGRLRALGIRRLELGFVGVDQAVDDGAAQEAREPGPHVRGPAPGGDPSSA